MHTFEAASKGKGIYLFSVLPLSPSPGTHSACMCRSHSGEYKLNSCLIRKSLSVDHDVIIIEIGTRCKVIGSGYHNVHACIMIMWREYSLFWLARARGSRTLTRGILLINFPWSTPILTKPHPFFYCLMNKRGVSFELKNPPGSATGSWTI